MAVEGGQAGICSVCMQVMKVLLEDLQSSSAPDWVEFQKRVSTLKLQRAAALRDLSDLRVAREEAAASAATRAASFAQRAGEAAPQEAADSGGRAAAIAAGLKASVNIVLVTGFESFNQGLYRSVARQVRAPPRCMAPAPVATVPEALLVTGVGAHASPCDLLWCWQCCGVGNAVVLAMAWGLSHTHLASTRWRPVE